MNHEKPEAIRELIKYIGRKNVIDGFEIAKNHLDNTLGVKRHVEAIVYPTTTENIKNIVEIANKYLIPLYPVSRGKNIGYGDLLPVSDGHIIVNLKNMNKISDFDDVHGTVYIQAGVSQQQLYDFLKANNSKFWMDVTGSGLDSSIIGNSLDGGFGRRLSR